MASSSGTAALPLDPPSHGPIAGAAAAGRLPAFGLAHVDLMDLHLERLPGGETIRREVLAPDEMAERYGHAAGSGAGWNRWSLYWDMVEVGARLDWSVADEIVERDRAAGLRTLAILQGTPARYATGGWPGAAYPRVGGHMPATIFSLNGPGDTAIQASVPRALFEPVFRRADGSPTDDPAEAYETNTGNPWSCFVAAAVERYRPGGDLARSLGWAPDEGVAAWEIGNEPNLRHFWDGSPAEYARYLEVAFLVIEWRDPGATVVHGGIADDAAASAWYNRFLDALEARAAVSPLPERYGYYFDAAGWHWYSYPALLHAGPQRARALLRDRGLPAKPIWVTEMGVPIWSEHPGPCWDPSSPWRATVAEQAGYVWQALAESVASEVDVAILFQAYDDCGNGPTSYDAFGLVRNHASNQCWTPPEGQSCWRLDPALAGVPRPAYPAFRVAAEQLDGAEPLWRPGRVDDWERILFYQPPDTRVTVAWNWSRSDRAVELGATGPQGKLFVLDASGVVSEQTRRPAGGWHSITLPAQTNRNNPGGGGLMAGMPVMLVERDLFAPFRVEMEPLPEVSPVAFDLGVSAADGGTGVGAVRVLVAERAPADPADWRVLADDVAWTDSPIGGRVSVPFQGEPGRTYYFGAQARDRAGNWTEPPRSAQATTLIDGSAASPTSTSSSQASPTATMRASATPPPSPTVASSPIRPPSPTPTATPGPPPVLDRSVFVPAVVRSGALCGLLGVDVRGPRGDALTDPRGSWTLRTFNEGGGVNRSTQPLGASACARAEAVRTEAWAVVPGFITFAPQDLSLSRDLFLAVAPNALVNGGFEAGIAGWTVAGDLPPLSSRAALAGSGSAVLGEGSSTGSGPASSANSLLHQDVVVPGRSPTLSLRYLFDSRQVCDADGCRHVDRIHVRVVDLDDPAQPVTHLTGPDGVREPSPSWAHAAFDLDAFAGHRIRLVVELEKATADGPGRLWLDNVSIGPAGPGGTEGSSQ
jgi:hypothetical protein